MRVSARATFKFSIASGKTKGLYQMCQFSCTVSGENSWTSDMGHGQKNKLGRVDSWVKARGFPTPVHAKRWQSHDNVNSGSVS